ncbi:MAG: hypothetical protein IT250_13000 [Chitinophagaceae bacterium]|nr:hypothetical protein [Chitinophagaceae bacterium]
MNTTVKLITASVAGIFFSGILLAQDIKVPSKIQKNLTPNQLPKNTEIPKDLFKKDIDLAVEKINLSIVSRKDNYRGRVKMEVVVKNVGRRNYTTGAEQQVAILYENTPGAGSRAVATKAFGNVAVNGTVKFSYYKDWQTSDEFPPTYTAVIVFDPDIYIDGNDNNDDSNASNNKKTVEGAQINSLPWTKSTK